MKFSIFYVHEITDGKSEKKAFDELNIARDIAAENKDLNTLNNIKNLIQSLNQIEK